MKRFEVLISLEALDFIFSLRDRDTDRLMAMMEKLATGITHFPTLRKKTPKVDFWMSVSTADMPFRTGSIARTAM